MGWSKPIAGGFDIHKAVYRRLGSKTGSVIYDTCDVRLTSGILLSEKHNKGREEKRKKGLLFGVTGKRLHTH